MGLGALSGLLVLALSPPAEASVPGGSEADIESALGHARASSGLVVVFLLGSSEEEEWAAEVVRCPEWMRSIHGHRQVVLRGDRSPSAAARFTARAFPLLLALDGEGKEIGRVHGEQPAEVLARKLRSMATAVEVFRASGGLIEEDAADPEALFWLGTYRWNQGDHFLAASCFRKLCEPASHGALLDGDVQSTAYQHLGEHALDRGEYAEAEQLFRRSMERARDVNSVRGAALGLSLSLRRLGKLPEAVTVLEGTLASGRPSSIDDQVLFAIGYLHRELREQALSRKYFEECATRFPGTLHGLRALRCASPDETVSRAPAITASRQP